MAIITNEDIKIMVEVEDLLYQKLRATNGIKDVYKGEEYYYFDENDKEFDIWNKYWNLVERVIVAKDKAKTKSNNWNKEHAEYHRLMNNLCNARKNNNKEKIDFYTQKLAEYKRKSVKEV